MQYRKFGKTGEKLSILGFGAMRLPLIDNDDKQIDYKEATAMVRYAIDNGVNYLDTAYPYHGGKSEAFCAHVMKDGYREKVKIATKCPIWDVQTHEDFDKFLDEQLKTLEVEQIDFYLIHALCQDFWDTCKKCDYKTFLDRAKASGKIKHAGFSFHADIDLFKEIVDDYDWDFCQIQLNYLDENYQAGLAGMRYAHEKGLGIVIMEPLRGGTLAKTELPTEVETLWNSCDTKRSPAEWALKYLWNYEEVGVILSGMSTMEQVIENVNSATASTPNSLTKQERETIDKVTEFYNSRMIVPCTKCKYCMPCPVGVDIPECFWAYNHDALFDDRGKADFWINGWLNKEMRPSNCIECGQCETKCPQNIEIIKHLKIIADKYEKKATE